MDSKGYDRLTAWTFSDPNAAPTWNKRDHHLHIIEERGLHSSHENLLLPGAMNYPPPHNDQYPPQYLHHQPPPPQQPPHQYIPPQQLLYNTVNPIPPPYQQYGKPPVHPQTMIPPYSTYPESYNNQQQRHQQPELSQQLQYVNPAQLFQQTPLPTPPRSHFTHGSQLDGQAPTPVTSIGRSPAPATTPATTVATATASTTTQPFHNVSAPSKSNAHGQTSHPASNSPQARPRTTPTPHTPSKPVPQVLIPAPSPEVQQKIQRQNSKKQVHRQTKQPSSSKPSKPSIDHQILLLSLADEYLNAAHNHGTMVALQKKEMGMEEYYKLVATGLGCLEAVLKVRIILSFLSIALGDVLG